MLKALMQSVTRINKAQRLQSRFFGDWIKDREKAAEKEFLMKEELEKSKKLKKKIEEGKHEVQLQDAFDHNEDITSMLNDREYLLVTSKEKTC